MKLCFFDDIHVLGGGELWILNVCRKLAAMGHEVGVICPYKSPLYEHCQAENIEVFAYVRMDGLPFYEPIYHFLKNREFDVVHCTIIGGFLESVLLESIVDRINRERIGSKMTLVLKTGLPPMTGLGIQHYGIGSGPAVARLHVVSQLNREAFIDWLHSSGAFFDEDYIEVMREGVELDRFISDDHKRDHAHLDWDVPEGHLIVTCLSRLHALKGQDNLLLAIPDILEKHKKTRFLIAGEGEELERLQNLCNHLGLQEFVKFLGHVHDVPTLLSHTDILCQPSLTDGVPNSVVEAMAMGVPIVASDTGGIPEVVRNGESGLLTPLHDIRGISKAITRLLSSSTLRHAYGVRGRQIVSEDFDFAKNLDHFLSRLDWEVKTTGRAYSAKSETQAPGGKGAVSVLFLMNAIRTGGEETELHILARHLNRQRFGMSVLSLFPVQEHAPTVERLSELGVAIDTHCHDVQLVEEKVEYVREKIRCEGITVVVACQDTSLAYQVFTQLSRDECRLIEHGGIVEETSTIPKHYTERYIGVSREIQHAAGALMTDPRKALHIPSMVDIEEFAHLNRDMLRTAYGFSPETVVVLFVGRLDPKKRVEDLMKAAATLISEYRHLSFLVVGGPDALQPDYATLLVKACQALIDTNRVVFAGTRGDVPSLMAASDILVLPGAGEGMSHVISEAGAAGMAVVAADDGAAREQLDDGQGGRIVPVGKPEVLYQALVELIENPTLRQRLGAHLKATVERRYSAQALAPVWESVLADVGDGMPESHEIYAQTWDRQLDFPTEIQIQTTTLCNASCIMCPYPQVSKEFPTGHMTDELYERILDECAGEPGLRRIEPFLMNEPFMDKRMVELIARTKQQVNHALVTLTTNGASLAPKVIDRLIQSGLDAVWFSFNGANPETYEKIMGISYAKVKRNIDYLLSVRPPTLQVFINMIETEPMAPEIEQNISYWRTRGVQAGSSPLVNRAGNVENFEELDYMPLSDKPVRTCELPFYKMYITYNGDVVSCCMDWRRQVVLGNITERGIRDIWNGPEYRRFRRLHIERQEATVDLCSACSYTFR